MTGKADIHIPTPQGGTALSPVGMADLYETRHGMFAGPRTLWEGGAAPDPASQGSTGAPEPQGSGSRLPADALERLERLVARNGGVDRTAELLFDENRTYRSRIRELEGQVPAQGAVVLTPEQAQQWQAYQQLSPDPAALRERLTQGDQFREREQGRELAEVGRADSTVLMDRLRSSGLRAEVREAPGQNGQPATRAVHLLNAEGQDQGELRAYATQHWGAYVPALFPQAAQGAGQGGGIPITGQAGAGAGSPQAKTVETRTAELRGQISI